MDATFHFKIVLLYVVHVHRHANVPVYIHVEVGEQSCGVGSLLPLYVQEWLSYPQAPIQAHLPLSHLTGPVADSTERFSGKTVCAPWLFVDSTLELEVFSLPLLQCSKQALSEHVPVSPTLRFDQRKDFSIKAGAQLTRESLRGWRKETRAD